MEKNEGFILLHRCLLKNPFLWSKNKYTKMEIWLDMLFMARWQDAPRTFSIRGNKVVVNRGEFAESAKDLAERWGWSYVTARNIIQEFEDEGMIEVERSNVICKIKIVNYDKYQAKSIQQNIQQIIQQSDFTCLQQDKPYLSSDSQENDDDSIQQTIQQNIQQTIQQTIQPYNNINNINNNISLSYNAETEKSFFEYLKRLDTQWKEQQCRTWQITFDDLQALIAKFESECQSNFDAHVSREEVVKHFRNWAKIEIDRSKKQSRQQYNGNNNSDSIRQNGRGAYRPNSEHEYSDGFNN